MITSPWALFIASFAILAAFQEPASSQTQGRGVESQRARDDLGPGDRRAATRVDKSVSFIPAGTVIGNTPPAGWTHMIAKSRPKMQYGDVALVPKPVQALSGMFFTALIARVSPPDGRDGNGYRLDEAALGMGTRIGATDMIITPETQKRLGANLGLLARVALERGYERLSLVKVAARTDTMAVIDAPIMLLRQGKHRPVMLRYAVLVDPRTGSLEMMMWAISQDDQGAYEGLISGCEWLSTNVVETRLLHVDASEFTLGLITENALAMVHWPQGRMQFEFPPESKRLAATPRPSQQLAPELEQQLWEFLRSAATNARQTQSDGSVQR
jgi:hypothetical protein